MRTKVAMLGLLLAGCASEGDGGPELLDGFEPPAPAEGQIQIVSPIVRDIASGADVTLCTYLPIDQALPSTLDVVGATGMQSYVGGHHAIIYLAERERPVDTHECTDDDMVNARYIAGAGGGDAGGFTDNIPEGVAYRIDAGRQLMVQTHWINTTPEPIDGQAAWNLTVQPPSDGVELANLFTWLSTEIEVAPGEPGAVHTDCVVERDMSFFQIGGHAHERGTRVSLTHTPSGQTANTFYDEAWTEYYTFDPPRLQYARDEAVQVRAGDTLSIDCEYFNDTEETLTFPLEMCVGFAFYYPAEKQLNCADGRWPTE
jgi:hypothetical protein